MQEGLNHRCIASPGGRPFYCLGLASSISGGHSGGLQQAFHMVP